MKTTTTTTTTTTTPVQTTQVPLNIRNNFLTICPNCGTKLRPYGADILVGEQGGCYHKLCDEGCKRAYIISKLNHEILIQGSLEEIIEALRIRKQRGIQ